MLLYSCILVLPLRARWCNCKSKEDCTQLSEETGALMRDAIIRCLFVPMYSYASLAAAALRLSLVSYSHVS